MISTTNAITNSSVKLIGNGMMINAGIGLLFYLSLFQISHDASACRYHISYPLFVREPL